MSPVSPSPADALDGAALLADVERFCAESVAPRAAEIDREAAFFPDLLREAADLGLQRLLFDAAGELDLTRMPLLHETTERIAAASGAVALAIAVARLHAYLLARYAEPAVAERWLEPVLAAEAFGSFAISEAAAGTDVRALRTVARREGDHYVLSGTKAWIGLAPVAAFSVVLAKLDTDARDADTIALLVELDADGVRAEPGPPLAGFRGMPNGTLAFDGVRVPVEHALRCDGFAGMMDGLNLARIDVASYACGLLRGCLEASCRHAASREAFGSPIGRLQAIQLKLGRMATDHRAARELALRAAERFAYGDGGDPALISMAKLFASEAARRHASEAIQIHGAAGLVSDSAVQRMDRDAKVTQIFDGTSEIHLLMIGRHALRAWAASPGG